MTDYKAIFDGIESTLYEEGNLPEDRIRECLDSFKETATQEFTDADYFWILTKVVFYSGFRAATVSARIDVIRQHFPSWQVTAGYGSKDVESILSDSRMIRNRQKIQSCVHNATAFAELVRRHGSIRNYIDSFKPMESTQNLKLLKTDIESRFRGLGKITSYHFMTDIGMPVLKPDRVVCRVLTRLGIIENESQTAEAVAAGRTIAAVTGHPIRYIDIVLVWFGQVAVSEIGLERGICLKDDPRCSVCRIRDFCLHCQKMKGPLVALPDLSAATSVSIQDEWSGLSSASPIRLSYTVNRRDDEFSGEAEFHVGGGENLQRGKRKANVPLGKMLRFLELLREAPLSSGPYQPTCTHTDDSPSIRIEIQLPSGVVEFFTESQGKDHVPWGARVDGRTYAVDSALPADAMGIVIPRSSRRLLDRMVRWVLENPD